MSGSAGGSKSKSKSGGGFSQDVWGGQSPFLQNLYQQAGNLFGSTTGNMNDMMGSTVGGMQGVTDAAQQGMESQLSGGAYSGLGIGNQLMQSLNQSQNSPSAMQEVNNMIMGGQGNNYADAMRDQYVNDANRATGNMLANLDSRAAASGMSGGSRHGIATAQGMEDINRNLQSNMANVGYNTFDKDLDRKLQIAGQADAANLGRQNLMSNMLGQQQDVMNTGMQNTQGVQNMQMAPFSAYLAPWQAMGAYSNAIGGPTVLSSGSQSANSKGSGKGASGSLGGMTGTGIV